jgi:ABC-type polysaccharide/polyol phosphate export permease
VTSVYKSLRSFVPAACVLVVIFPLMGGRVGPGLLVLPLLFALQVVMNVGIALLVSTYVVLVPDGNNVVQWVNRLLFFATPVIYPVALLPPAAKAVLLWQPLFPLFASYQAVLGGSTPSPGLVMLSALWAGALLVIGARVFLKHERQFALHL